MKRKLDTYTIRLRRGVDYSKLFKILQPDSSTPVDITGWNPVITILTETAATLTFDEASGHLTLDEANGKITLQIPAATVNGYSWAKGKWNLSSRISGGKQHIKSGLVEVLDLYE